MIGALVQSGTITTCSPEQTCLCRGRFNCSGATVLCGFPPGSMYYRCSCSSGRDAQSVQQEYQSTKIRTDSIPGTNVKKVGRSVRADLEAMISGYNPDVYVA